MSVQLILKNSAVQDKEATAAQLAVGEIALNYYESGPFLQCKDTNGDVWRIGGVVIASTAPASPSKGAWWFDSDTDQLFFYNGTAWKEIQVGDIAVSDIAEGTARQLLQTNAAGTATEWTSNVDIPGTLDVTGAAAFDNNVVIQGNLTVNGTTTTIDSQTLLVEDKNIEMGVVTTPTDTTADGGGITLKGTTDKTINWINATDAWTSSEHIDLASGKSYRINGTEVLSATALGSAVQISSANIPSGTIVNDDVNASAAIAGTKISPDFGSQTVQTTGVISHALGTAGAPTVTFTGDTNTGIYSPGADQVAISTGGSGRLFIDASGQVGIGAAPAVTFDIQAASARSSLTSTSGTSSVRHKFTNTGGNLNIGIDSSTGAIFGAAYAGVFWYDGAYPLLFGTNNTERLRITSDGKLGLGTSSPAYTFDCNGDINISGAYRIGTGTVLSYGGGNVRLSDIGGGVDLRTNSTSRLFITNAGNVGIGTSSPSSLLHVAGSSPAISLIPSGATNAKFIFDNSLTFSGSNGSNDRLHINFDGKVGIGTSTPEELLHLNAVSSGSLVDLLKIDNGGGANGTEAGIVFECGVDRTARISSANTGSDLGALKFWTAGSVDTLTERLRIDSSGRVGIGTTSPSVPLHVSASTVNTDVAIFTGSNLTRGLKISTFVSTSNDGGVRYNAQTVGGAHAWDINGTESARIDSSGRLLVGTSTARSPLTHESRLQVEGTDYSQSTVSIISNATDGSGPTLLLGKSRSGSLNGNTVVQNGDDLGQIYFIGADGSDLDSRAATIKAQVDGTPGANDMPGRLVFSTTADGASSPTERVRIQANGQTKFSGSTYGVEQTITAGTFDMAAGNFFTVGAVAIPNPTNATAGMSGLIRITAAPTSWGSNFDFPGGAAPTIASFPAIIPFYVQSSTVIMMGNVTAGIA